MRNPVFFIVFAEGLGLDSVSRARRGTLLWDLDHMHPSGREIPGEAFSRVCSGAEEVSEKDLTGPGGIQAPLESGTVYIRISDDNIDAVNEKLSVFLCRLNSTFTESNGIIAFRDGFKLIAPENALDSLDLLPGAFKEAVKRAVSHREEDGREGKGGPLPDLSVVIPTRNRPGLLREYFECLVKTDIRGLSFEHVVVDDGGTPETGDVIREAKEKYPFLVIRYFRQEPMGPGEARNLGISESRGRIIAFWGDDFRPSENLLRQHLEFHERYPAFGAGLLGMTKWDPGVDVTPFMEYITTEDSGGAQFANEYLLKRYSNRFIREDGFFYTSNISVKTGFLTRYGRFYGDIFKEAMLEDIELGIRLSRAGLRLFFDPGAFGFHKHAITIREFFRREQKYRWYLAEASRLHPEKFKFVLPGFFHSLSLDLRAEKWFYNELKSLDALVAKNKEMDLLAPLFRKILDFGALFGSVRRKRLKPELKLTPFAAILHSMGMQEKAMREEMEEIERANKREFERRLENERKTLVVAIQENERAKYLQKEMEIVKKYEKKIVFLEKTLKQRAEKEKKVLEEKLVKEKLEALARARERFLEETKRKIDAMEEKMRKEAIQRIERMRKEIETSFSWKITKPIRLLGKVIALHPRREIQRKRRI